LDEFESLYHEHAGSVFRFALHLCGDRDEAADLTSEAFLRAWASPAPIRVATVRSYLFTIARRLYLQGLRRGRRRAPVDEALPDPSPGPAQAFEVAHDLRVALSELQRLGEADRAALVLRVVEDMPYDEIAATLGISLAATKVRIHRARLALIRRRETMNPAPNEAPDPPERP
jgi:RNA polymerase sigma-70 factor (ECF subfamily)